MFPILTLLLHAWWSIGAVALGLFAAAAAAFFFGFRRISFVLAGFAGVALYSGALFQAGVSECQEAVRQAVAAEQERQRLIGAEAVTTLSDELAATTTRNLEAERRAADYAAQLAKIPACILNEADIRAINGP